MELGQLSNNYVRYIKNTQFYIILYYNGNPRTQVKSGHYRPASGTPSGWRFAGGPIVARDRILAGLFLKLDAIKIAMLTFLIIFKVCLMGAVAMARFRP